MWIVRLVLVLNLFFTCLLVKISAYSVQYYDNQDTWLDAQKRCYDMGDRLATNDDELNCNLLSGHFDSSKRITYWTGKYKTVSHWISKIGCFNILGTPKFSPAHSVSRCFEVCREQHIQIKLLAHKGNNCVCISENTPSLQKIDIIDKCNQPVKSYNHNYYWAYIVTQNTTLNGSGNCAFVDCGSTPAVVRTANCSTERASFCDFDARINWLTSEERCKHQELRNTEDICRQIKIEHPGAWLPMHRVPFWTEVTRDGVDKEEAEYITECQSFLCPNNAATPIPANTPCSEKTNGFLCVSSSNNMTRNRNKTLTDSAAQYPGILSYESTKSRGTDAQTINAGRKTGTTSTIGKQKENRNFTDITDHHSTSNIGLIVGGLLGALAIFSVIILAVILTLRRKKASTKNQNVQKSEMSNEDHQRTNRSNNTRVNQLYEDEGAHADRPVPLRTKEAEIAHEQEGKKPNDVYAHVMKNNKPSTLQVGLPSVVSLTDVVESEYDRLNITPNFLADNMENNVYDSSIAERCESDPTYNTATNIRHSRINTEDVYN